MAVHVVRKRNTVLQPNCLQRLDMIPSVFPPHYIRIQKVATVIVEARDKTPPIIDVGRPPVMGRVVLNQLSGVVGDYLPIVMFSFGLPDVETVFFALSIMVGTDTS